MRGSPASPLPEHGPISSVPKFRSEKAQPERPSTSAYVRPKVLMGEVTAPPNAFNGSKGQMLAASRNALRAFMMGRRLVPSAWSREAGVPAAPLLAFLAGTARRIPPDIAAKLAAVAKVSIEEMFR
ncbi:MAG: hypothetical protein JWP16_2049 [Alphaproteobacteria bacterium]|jgi:hypothetical protein|nr:hypothetical protein [Alphaproteobacteria bacterium]MDB5741009.1 hypothetical protein [Alphaproteobacteria bacterium]